MEVNVNQQILKLSQGKIYAKVLPTKTVLNKNNPQQNSDPGLIVEHEKET